MIQLTEKFEYLKTDLLKLMQTSNTLKTIEDQSIDVNYLMLSNYLSIFESPKESLKKFKQKLISY